MRQHLEDDKQTHEERNGVPKHTPQERHQVDGLDAGTQVIKVQQPVVLPEDVPAEQYM